MDFYAFTDEFCKLSARPISKEEAEKSLRKLKGMEEDRDLGALGRSAGVGAALMPGAGMAARLVAGTQKFMKPGKSFNIKRPWQGVNVSSLGRQAASDAMYGAIGGGAIPLAREKVESTVQKERLRDYIDQHEGRQGGKSFRRQVKGAIGV